MPSHICTRNDATVTVFGRTFNAPRWLLKLVGFRGAIYGTTLPRWGISHDGCANCAWGDIMAAFDRWEGCSGHNCPGHKKIYEVA